MAWLAAALAAALLLAWWQLGWWIGHGLEVLGIAVVGVSVAIDLRRSAQSRPLVADLGAGELAADDEAFLGAQVRALTTLLAERGVGSARTFSGSCSTTTSACSSASTPTCCASRSNEPGFTREPG